MPMEFGEVHNGYRMQIVQITWILMRINLDFTKIAESNNDDGNRDQNNKIEIF
jgi:hypothetical protein